MRDAFASIQGRSSDASEFQAAWERSELARAEIANGNPHFNAQALISINSALDAMVEEWIPAMRKLWVRWFADQLWEKAAEVEPQAAQQMDEDERERLLKALREAIAAELPKSERLRGSGAQRYETVLAQEGLAAPPTDRSRRTSTRR